MWRLVRALEIWRWWKTSAVISWRVFQHLQKASDKYHSSSTYPIVHWIGYPGTKTILAKISCRSNGSQCYRLQLLWFERKVINDYEKRLSLPHKTWDSWPKLVLETTLVKSGRHTHAALTKPTSQVLFSMPNSCGNDRFAPFAPVLSQPLCRVREIIALLSRDRDVLDSWAKWADGDTVV